MDADWQGGKLMRGPAYSICMAGGKIYDIFVCGRSSSSREYFIMVIIIKIVKNNNVVKKHWLTYDDDINNVNGYLFFGFCWVGRAAVW